ncbi:phytanoyl-CoA dioxygenase, peroxisomal-like isoform X2 [Saccostrea cucullata]|uniref:phytanoyl-CoA dioxygenase, peroxisomal-like isoform X2 n=1 Tax=Saccostrea cuccullata TaxID=36930 RepID=UPI002ED00182
MTMTDRLKTVFGHLQSETHVHTQRSSASSLVHTGSPRFRYTRPGGFLTESQRQFYEDNGFLVIKRLVPHQKLDMYRDRFEKICRKEVVDYVKAIIGDEVNAIHTMLINKPPDPGKKTSRHPLHQDLHYFPFRPADKICCSWTAMEVVNRENGCLVVLPGSHKGGKLLQHEYPQWEGGVHILYHGVRDFDPTHPRSHLLMDPGDTVFFHPLLIHGSGMNRTKGFRKSISCHYASSDCEYINVRGSEQEKMADEIVNMVLKKHKIIDRSKITFEDIWRYKLKPVRGTKD